MFLFFFRLRGLAGTDKLESVASREAAFFVNNVVLVAIAAAVFFLSFFQKISHDWFARQLSNLSIFNIVMTPCFALLLFLTAVGPGLGWVKTTGASFRRNFLWPIAATLVFTILVYVFLGATGRLGTREEVFGIRLQDPHPSALYPTGLFIALSFFIIATVSFEFLRGLKSRVKFRKEDIATAFGNLVFRQNRRYGGYTVHVGIAILATGIVASSMFQVREENVVLAIGESARVGPYVVTPVESRSTEPGPGEPYVKDEILFRVTRAVGGLLPVAHGETPAESARSIANPGNADASGEVVSELWCERRFYPKKGEWISEVSIDRKVFEDIYIFFPQRLPDGRAQISFFINPLMFLIYLGWFTMIAGGLFAALPLSGSRVGLSE
jgi:cytochrome c-type biogenesis protein CcmF